MVKVKVSVLRDKLYKNALIGERLSRLDSFERQKIILKLLESRTHRELGEELGISHSTIYDWKSLRQSNVGKDIHVSLALIYRKLKCLDVCDITDWGRVEMIKNRCEELLNRRR